MSGDYKLAYSRGYNTASRRAWPAHKPPEPPNEIVAGLMRAARSLRDGADLVCCQLTEDDEFVQTLAPRIDAMDAALARVTEWMVATEGGEGTAAPGHDDGSQEMGDTPSPPVAAADHRGRLSRGR